MSLFAILEKQNFATPVYRLLDKSNAFSEIKIYLDNLSLQREMALDFETYSLDPRSDIRSVSFCNDHCCVAIDLLGISADIKQYIAEFIYSQELIAHNIMMEGAFLYERWEQHPKYHCCTYGLYKMLSSEGYPEQRYGCKEAMMDVLGWTERNDIQLTNWLIENNKDKSQMSDAPWEILGPYNALDAAASWQLYKYFKSVLENNDWGGAVWEFHQVEFMNQVELLIEQQLSGMNIDVKKAVEYGEKLDFDIDRMRKEFVELPEVAPLVEEYQQQIVNKLLAKEPTRYKKDGETSARWYDWMGQLQLQSTAIDFNIDSPKQLAWLLGEGLGIDNPIVTGKNETFSVGKKALKYFGDIGKFLAKYRKLRDKRKFVTSLINIQEDGMFFPKVKSYGTMTGRASGGAGED